MEGLALCEGSRHADSVAIKATELVLSGAVASVDDKEVRLTTDCQ
jgi:hypothetical protein